MVNDLERQIISLVATDRLYVPSSSFDGKLERSRPKIAEAIASKRRSYTGERTHMRVKDRDHNKARGMRHGIETFTERFPKYGAILNGIIQEERTVREKHLYFGMNEGKRLTNDDYLAVLTDMGMGPVIAERYCEVALDISRTLMKKREETDRRILIG